MASKARRLGRVSAVVGAVWVALWALCAATVSAQTARTGSTAVAGMSATADGVIEEMAAAAGVIFAGQVTAVRPPTGPAGPQVVEVEFRVDEAVKGPATGSFYTLREWAGLWNVTGGRGRYRTGQRLLIFLYAPDENGFSSPVRGLDGAMPLRGSGRAPGPDDAGSAAADWMVDLRWVQAQALKSYAPAAPPAGGGPVSPRPISPVPVFPVPISPSPVHSGPVYPAPVHRLTVDLPGTGAERPEVVIPYPARPETDAVREIEIGIEPREVRQLPVPAPGPPPAPAELQQPLAQVIALCRRAIRSSNGLR